MDLEAPKPTKEFHDAYKEIYTKKKQDQQQIDVTPPAKDEEALLNEMDLPPLKAPGKDAPKQPEKKKSGFFSNLFKKKKEQPELDHLDLPPPKLAPDAAEPKDQHIDDLGLPPMEAKLGNDKEQELQQFSDSDIEAAAKEIEAMDLPPPKKPKAAKKAPKAKPAPQPKTEKGRVHDFLAEIKFGGKQKAEPKPKEEPKKKGFSFFKKKEAPKEEPMQQAPEMHELPTELPGLSPKPVQPLDEHEESMFEKQKMDLGARDMQTVYEQKHPNEMGGFEFLEKIEPPKKPQELVELEQNEPVMPQAKQVNMLTKQDVKKHMQEIKAFEKDVKKRHTLTKKEMKKYIKELKDHEKKTHESLKVSMQDYMKKCKVEQAALKKWKQQIAMQEARIDEKTKKMQRMEKALEQKQAEVMHYEPQLAELHRQKDAVLEKEREVKQRQLDVREVEIKLKQEEDAIVKKIKELEKDQKMLRKEEDAIIRATNKLEKERKKLNDKTKELAALAKDVEKEQRAMRRKAGLLDERETILRRKERIIDQEVTRVQKLKKTAEKLKDVEARYERMKQRLRDAHSQHSSIYMQKVPVTEPSIKPARIEPTFQMAKKDRASAAISGDISNIISSTRQLIMQKHYDEANKSLNVLMSKYMQIPDNNPRKKEIYYEILGLKNMLKLELLE